MRLILIVFVLLSLNLFGQDRLIRLNYDNDYFSATDRYYTQGVRLEYIAPFFERSPINYALVKNKKATISYAGIAIERDGFTAQGILIDTIPVGNRPYAGTMFLSNFLTVFNQANHTKIYSQFDIGIIGPAVGGKQEQTGIHTAIGDVLPQGWKYQISNDVILNYTFQFDKGFIDQQYVEFIGLSQGRLGTLYTDVSAGTKLRLGWMNSYFTNLGITKQPLARKFQAYIYGKGMVKAVGYNATMQGGLFSESIYTIKTDQINRLVGQAFYGVVVSYKRFQLEYGKVNITQEFKGGLPHGWGHCSIVVCF